MMGECFMLLKRLGIRRKYVLLLLLRSPFDALRTWMQAWLLKSVFLCLETKAADRLSFICAGGALLCAMLFLYNGTIWSIYAAFTARTEARLQKEMRDKILSLPCKRVHGRHSGQWLTGLNGDIQAAITMMNGPMNLPHGVTALINTILSLLLMWKGSPALLGVTGLFLFPHLLVTCRLVWKRLPGLREESRRAMADATVSVRPLIADAEAILLYDAGGLMLEKCEQESRRLLMANMKMHMRSGLSDMICRLLGISGYLAVLMAGLSMTRRGMMAFSDVVYCFQVRGAVLTGIHMLITCVSNIRMNSVCVKKIKDVLEE